MGQGALTGIAMLVAEELEVDLAQVRTEFAPVDRAYANPMFGEQSTGGSTSIRSSYEPLRRAGASAREMLVAAAAAAWNVPLVECSADSGAVRHLPSNKVLGYGALAAKASKLAPPASAALKERASFRLIGANVPRMELPGHVRGETVYGFDVRVPDMVYAVIQRPPAAEARLAEADTSRAEATRGVVQVIEVPAGARGCRRRRRESVGSLQRPRRTRSALEGARRVRQCRHHARHLCRPRQERTRRAQQR